jgi:hypothetical protein
MLNARSRLLFVLGVKFDLRYENMARFKSTLGNVRIAARCSADWDSMFGNERIRFCGQCQLNVYNLSEMSEAEAERLIGQTEGRLCVRYYRRQDGSIITQNCPIGLRAIKRRLSRAAKAVAFSVLGFITGIDLYRNADKLFFPPHVMGQMVTVHDNQAAPPVVQGGLAVSPSHHDVVVGKLVPIKTHRKPVSKFRK